MKLHSRNRKRKFGEFADNKSEIPEQSQASSMYKRLKPINGTDDSFS